MTKLELIDKVKGDLTRKQAEDVVEGVFAAIGAAIKKEKRFAYPGFGTFTVRTRKARTGRNPRTGATIKIAASKTVGFKAAPKLKGSL